MNLRLIDRGNLLLSRVSKWELTTLRHIPILADPSGHAAAERRLFPDPVTGDAATEEDREDWEEWVIPAHRQLFESDLECVAQDVATASEEMTRPRRRRPSPDLPEPKPRPAGTWTFTIPVDHVDHWYRAMNQARLVMSARYQIDSERNPQEYIEKMIAEGTMERLIQYELFTSLQQWLVVNIMDTGG